MKIQWYCSDDPDTMYPDESGTWVHESDVARMEAKIVKLEAQLKHNKDRDYAAGFEAGLCAGLNGGA